MTWMLTKALLIWWRHYALVSSSNREENLVLVIIRKWTMYLYNKKKTSAFKIVSYWKCWGLYDISHLHKKFAILRSMDRVVKPWSQTIMWQITWPKLVTTAENQAGRQPDRYKDRQVDRRRDPTNRKSRNLKYIFFSQFLLHKTYIFHTNTIRTCKMVCLRREL